MEKLFWRIVNFIFRRHFVVHIFLVVVVLLAGIFLYFEAGSTTQEALVQQMLHREQVITMSGSISLSVFVQSLSNQVSAYTTRPYIENLDKENTQKDINILMNSWRETPVFGVVLVDKTGVIRYGADRTGVVGIGTDVSTRAYYTWAKTALPGDRYVGSPIISKVGFAAGRYVVPVAAPVFKDGKFNGVLVIAFLVDEATVKFLDPLKISNGTLIFLLDANGNFVFSPTQKLVGTNLTNLFKDIDFSGKNTVLSELSSEFNNSNTQGKLDITIPNIAKDNQMTRFLLTYSVVSLGPGNDWSLVVLTPASDAFLFTGPFYQNQLFFLIYIIIVTLTFSIVDTTSRRIGERRFKD